MTQTTRPRSASNAKDCAILTILGLLSTILERINFNTLTREGIYLLSATPLTMNSPKLRISVGTNEYWIGDLSRRLLPLVLLVIALAVCCVPNSALAIAINDNVITTGACNVRSSPAGTLYANGQPNGATGVVIGGPTTASLSGTSYVWWNINFSSGQDGWVASINIQTVSTVPASPTSLYASGGNNVVGLAWNDNSNNETGFKLERKVGSGGSWSLYATLGANVAGATDTSVTPGTTYFYRVYAYNSYGPSPYYSNEASATPTGGTPPTATTKAASSITASSAQMNATINPNGYNTTAYF